MIVALFENGASAELKVALYKAPGDRARLLDAYVTTECEGAVTRSARRAAEAVLNWLPPTEHPKEPLVAGFDLAGVAVNQSLAGESAGLAFAVALAAQLTGRDPGTMAVTGILAEGNASATILPVKGLAAKLGAALQCPGVSIIVYPADNSDEVDAVLSASAQAKGIRLVAVNRVLEALEILSPSTPEQDRPARKGNFPRALFVATFLGLVLVGVVFWMTVHFGEELVGKQTSILPVSGLASESASAPAATTNINSGNAGVSPVSQTGPPAPVPSVATAPENPASMKTQGPDAGTSPPTQEKSQVRPGGGFD